MQMRGSVSFMVYVCCEHGILAGGDGPQAPFSASLLELLPRMAQIHWRIDFLTTPCPESEPVCRECEIDVIPCMLSAPRLQICLLPSDRSHPSIAPCRHRGSSSRALRVPFTASSILQSLSPQSPYCSLTVSLLPGPPPPPLSSSHAPSGSPCRSHLPAISSSSSYVPPGSSYCSHPPTMPRNVPHYSDLRAFPIWILPYATKTLSYRAHASSHIRPVICASISLSVNSESCVHTNCWSIVQEPQVCVDFESMLHTP